MGVPLTRRRDLPPVEMPIDRVKLLEDVVLFFLQARFDRGKILAFNDGAL